MSIRKTSFSPCWTHSLHLMWWMRSALETTPSPIYLESYFRRKVARSGMLLSSKLLSEVWALSFGWWVNCVLASDTFQPREFSPRGTPNSPDTYHQLCAASMVRSHQALSLLFTRLNRTKSLAFQNNNNRELEQNTLNWRKQCFS